MNRQTLLTIQEAVFDSGWDISSLLVWAKQWFRPNAAQGLRPSYELAAQMSQRDLALPNRGLPDIWRHQAYSDRPTGHPAENPEELLMAMVKQTPSAVICDQFMGSGATGVPAVKQGRAFVGVQLEPKRFDSA